MSDKPLTTEELADLLAEDARMNWDGDTFETFGPDPTPRFRTTRRGAWPHEIALHRALLSLAALTRKGQRER